MKKPQVISCAFLSLAALVAVTVALAQTQYSPGIDAEYPQNLYWGDTHLHTRNSPDAYSLGNMNLSQADAYRFAMGQELRTHNGMRVRLKRPLDFLVVSDHSEYLGGYFRFALQDKLIMDTDVVRHWQAELNAGNPLAMVLSFSDSMNSPGSVPIFPKEVQLEIWKDVVQTSDEYNQPGRFTALTGYEWTAMKDGNNLHRVVVLADEADKAGQVAPFTGQESVDARDRSQREPLERNHVSRRDA